MQQLVEKSVDELIPYARNSRTHTDEQVAQIAASIREFGWTNPILLDGQNGIVAGHGRLLAARKLGMDVVPCIELAGLSEAQRRAYVIADNKLALNAGWADDLLALELGELRDVGFDMDAVGFSEGELADLLSDQVPPSRAQPTVPNGYFVLVVCDSEGQQQAVYDEMSGRSFVCRLMN